MKKFILVVSVIVSLPTVAFAAADAFTIITRINQILSWLIPVLITFAVVYFIWGVIMYLIAGDEEKKKKATGMIIGGLIGLFIIIAFWGIIRIVSSTFDVGPEQLNPNAIPCIPGPGVNC